MGPLFKTLPKSTAAIMILIFLLAHWTHQSFIELTEKDLYDSMKSMENEKSPGNDGLTNEFYKLKKGSS